MAKSKAKQANNDNKSWRVDSWQGFPIRHQPEYEDKAKLHDVYNELSKMPQLVSIEEVKSLKKELALACDGKAFLLQGGDCAESFAEFSEKNLRDYFRVMLQMTVALMYGASKHVVKVGRIAGQFGKPRSSPVENIDGVELESYKGDNINAMPFDEKVRKADPQRLLRAYYQAGATLNFLRSLARGGYASLRQISAWNQEFASKNAQGKRFAKLVDSINESIRFIESCGIPLDSVEEFSEASFYSSHEALLPGFEQCFVREDKEANKFYDCSAHMLWIGDRTRSPEEAHVEFLRGVENPIGVKVGPTTPADDLVRLCDILNPQNEKGKLVLISRQGAGKVQEILTPLVERIRDEGKNVVWSCDPMHGNTIKSPNGYKTRKFNDILAEIKQFFEVHAACGTIAGGIHFEMTGQDVTECLGGAQAISEIDLSDRYHTHCDPRLNASQSLELAFLIAEELRN